jgi:prepilin-type N-terminal cleavage/methylation domain-containing protein
VTIDKEIIVTNTDGRSRAARRERGFTLVEVLMAASILTFLALLALPR